jgi:hypothetical protein
METKKSAKNTSPKKSEGKVEALLKQVAEGDVTVFARCFLTMDFLGAGGLDDLFYGTDIRRKHSENYIRTFERLCRLGKNCDVEGIIESSLMQNAFGLLYLRLRTDNPDQKAVKK